MPIVDMNVTSDFNFLQEFLFYVYWSVLHVCCLHGFWTLAFVFVLCGELSFIALIIPVIRDCFLN